MRALLLDRDYVPDGGGRFRCVSGEEAILNEALFRLVCRRGQFPFLPELGSRLWLLPQEKPSRYESAVRQYAAEALDGLDLQLGEIAVVPSADGGLHISLAVRAGTAADTLEVTV